MTDLDIIKNAIDVLGIINVPVGLHESIGTPIYQVRKNLLALYEVAIQRTSEKAANKEENNTENTDGSIIEE